MVALVVNHGHVGKPGHQICWLQTCSQKVADCKVPKGKSRIGIFEAQQLQHVQGALTLAEDWLRFHGPRNRSRTLETYELQRIHLTSLEPTPHLMSRNRLA